MEQSMIVSLLIANIVAFGESMILLVDYIDGVLRGDRIAWWKVILPIATVALGISAVLLLYRLVNI
jgi:hypothetical protein